MEIVDASQVCPPSSRLMLVAETSTKDLEELATKPYSEGGPPVTEEDFAHLGFDLSIGEEVRAVGRIALSDRVSNYTRVKLWGSSLKHGNKPSECKGYIEDGKCRKCGDEGVGSHFYSFPAILAEVDNDSVTMRVHCAESAGHSMFGQITARI